MTFEEFFKKKKINLQTFGEGEAALLSEFKIHFDQMGEKSFDHTKKYWFNKLRLRFPAPQEVKTEKVAIANPLAEQTITESLIESSSPTPNVGFRPKFKAGITKPAESAPEEAKENTEQASPTPNAGFKPRFKAGVTKPAEAAPEETKENTEPAPPPPNVGFKPRFKAGVTKPAEAAPEDPKENTEPAPLSSNVGFKPRFKAGVTKTALPPAGQNEKPKAEEPPAPDQQV